jgi:hypothetical protein
MARRDRRGAHREEVDGKALVAVMSTARHFWWLLATMVCTTVSRRSR